MELSFFELNASRELGERVARALGSPLTPHEEREFEDGEHKARPLESVRGRDVYVLVSLYGDARQSVNDKLVRLLFFLGALRDASAGRITAVIPYLCYARKDRRSKSRDPVATRYVAGLLETVGADRVVTLDVHNLAAYENAFRIRAEHLQRSACSSMNWCRVSGASAWSWCRPTWAGSSAPRISARPLRAGWGAKRAAPSSRSTAAPAS